MKDKLAWHNEKRKVDDLIKNPANPRRMSEKQAEELRKSLEKFNLAEVPAVNTDNRIVAGHMRVATLQLLGRGGEEIDVRVPNRPLTEKEYKEYLLRSNQNRGEFDWELLANNFEINELIGAGFDEELSFMFDDVMTLSEDDALFGLVQQVRAGRKRTGRGGVERSFGLLTGIAKCIRCGLGVGYQKRQYKRSKKNPNWNDTTTHEYICTGYKYRGICSQRVMSASKLEGSVLDQIKNLFKNPKVQERIVYDGEDQEAIDREKEILRLGREMASEETKLLRQHEAYERSVISMDEYQQNIGRIREETAKCRTEQERLQSHGYLTSQKSVAIAKLLDSFRDFDNLWGAMALDERKMILRSVVKEVRAGNDKVEIDFIM